jgi:hypothetical protein
MGSATAKLAAPLPNTAEDPDERKGDEELASPRTPPTTFRSPKAWPARGLSGRSLPRKCGRPQLAHSTSRALPLVGGSDSDDRTHAAGISSGALSGEEGQAPSRPGVCSRQCGRPRARPPEGKSERPPKVAASSKGVGADHQERPINHLLTGRQPRQPRAQISQGVHGADIPVHLPPAIHDQRATPHPNTPTTTSTHIRRPLTPDLSSDKQWRRGYPGLSVLCRRGHRGGDQHGACLPRAAGRVGGRHAICRHQWSADSFRGHWRRR